MLGISVIPSYFLTLLWNNNSHFIRLSAFAGEIAIAVYTILFFKMLRYQNLLHFHKFSLSKTLLNLAFVSFVIKSLLQAGSFYPALANAVFGLRPIIIGFLHLVFLGLISFYILSVYIESGVFNVKMRLTKAAFTVFLTAVIVQETILMVQGIGLLLGMANQIYTWLLWYASILLLLGGLMLLLARIKSPLYPVNERLHV